MIDKDMIMLCRLLMGRGRPKKKRNYNRLSEGNRGRAYGMCEEGASHEAIAAKLNCDRSTVGKIKKKYETKGTFKDLPKIWTA